MESGQFAYFNSPVRSAHPIRSVRQSVITVSLQITSKESYSVAMSWLLLLQCLLQSHHQNQSRCRCRTHPQCSSPSWIVCCWTGPQPSHCLMPDGTWHCQLDERLMLKQVYTNRREKTEYKPHNLRLQVPILTIEETKIVTHLNKEPLKHFFPNTM